MYATEGIKPYSPRNANESATGRKKRKMSETTTNKMYLWVPKCDTVVNLEAMQIYIYGYLTHTHRHRKRENTTQKIVPFLCRPQGSHIICGSKKSRKETTFFRAVYPLFRSRLTLPLLFIGIILLVTKKKFVRDARNVVCSLRVSKWDQSHLFASE